MLDRDDEVGFVRTRPLTPGTEQTARADLAAYLVGDSDPGRFGTLTSYVMSTVNSEGERREGAEVENPTRAQVAINNDPRISEKITLLSQRGSDVQFGAMMLIPIGETVMYVRPLYVVGQGTDSSPALNQIVVVWKGSAYLGDTQAEAINAALSGESEAASSGDSSGGESSGGEPSTDAADPGDSPGAEADAAELISSAISLMDEAEAAKGEPDGLATYEERNAEARDLLDRAAELLGTEVPPTSTTVAG
jgi:uncharacterized membrane protein (UPF0182 family)